MDATGLNALEDLYDKLKARHKHLILSGPHTQPLLVMDKSGFLDRIGRENVCAHIDASLERARAILDQKIDGRPPVMQPAARAV
jgi:SulP family sulfate permease